MVCWGSWFRCSVSGFGMSFPFFPSLHPSSPRPFNSNFALIYCRYHSVPTLIFYTSPEEASSRTRYRTLQVLEGVVTRIRRRLEGGEFGKVDLIFGVLSIRRGFKRERWNHMYFSTEGDSEIQYVNTAMPVRYLSGLNLLCCTDTSWGVRNRAAFDGLTV
jgi:hypothetical protein